MIDSIARFIVLLSMAAGAWAAQRFTVDLMLRNEEIRKVSLSADGRRLVFARTQPYASARIFRTGQGQGRLFYVDTQSDGEPKPLFAQDELSDYQLGDFSPDGRYVVYFRSAYGVSVLGVYDFQKKTPVELSCSLAGWGSFSVRWISRSEIVFLGSDETPPGSADPGYNVEIAARQAASWKDRWEGKTPTVSAIGAGRYNTYVSRRHGFLAVADAASGAWRRIGDGDYLATAVRPSPDGRRLAVLRLGEHVHPDRQKEYPHEAYWRQYKKTLAIHDSTGRAAPRIFFEHGDVDALSLAWSEDGSRLAFFAEGDPFKIDESDGYSAWVYCAEDGSLRRFDLGILALQPRSALIGGKAGRLAWLGRNLAVFARLPAGIKESTGSWFLLRPGVPPLDVLAAFGSRPVQAEGYFGDALVVLAENRVWSVDSAGARRQLTPALEGDVGIVGRSYLADPMKSFGSSLRAIDTMMLSGGSKAVFLDLRTRRTQELAIKASGTIMTFAARSPVLVSSGRHSGRETLSVACAAGQSRDIVTINGHLSNVVPAQVVQVRHSSPGGKELFSWLLLPPGYEKTDGPLPTVVYPYPGELPRDWSPSDLSQMDWSNQQILPGIGYAAFYPSLPFAAVIEPYGPAQDPLRALPPLIDSAVDAAVATGFVDGSRLAIQGQSYGGYLVLGVIGQSDRYKAAVASSGVYELTGYWGQSNWADRILGEYGDLAKPGVYMSEFKGFSLGGPPWKDPQRYLGNSPLMQVESIHTPVMLMAGDLDTNVPFAQSEEMFTALWRLNKNAVFLRYWGEGHSMSSPANIRDFWRRVRTFYGQHIGPPFDGSY